MWNAVSLRGDFTASEVRVFATRSRDSAQTRRLLSIAAVYDGLDRGDAARIGGMDRQTLRDWVHRFNADGPEGLIDRWAGGPKSRLTAAQKEELSRIVDEGPDPDKDGVVRWRCLDLKGVIQKHFGVDYHERTVGKILKELGFSHVSARPQHRGQNPETIEAFKKNFPQTLAAAADHLAPKTRIEIWWQDEARVGQKNGLVYQWAQKGSRPRQPKDQRYKNAYLFGAICPARGVGAGLVMPFADTDAMQKHLKEISRVVSPGACAVLLMDQAGWHTTGELKMPKNIIPIFLPPRSPELNSVENIWQYLRQTWLSNRVFESYEEIVDACCDAWNKLIDRPWKIMSIGMRKWAYAG